MKSRRLFSITLLALATIIFSTCASLGRNYPSGGIAELGDYSEGLVAFRMGELWGYLDTSFKVAILPQFHTAGRFHEGQAAVRLSKKWGFIDKRGKYVIMPSFKEAGDFSEKLAAVLRDGLWGYVGLSGENRIAAQFDEARPFSEGMAAVLFGSRWAYVDDRGHMAVNPLFVKAGAFVDGLAPVQAESGNAGWGYIGKDGAFAIPASYDEARPFAEGRAAVRVDSFWGYVDKSGALAVNPTYDEAGPFSDGRARVRKGQAWGYIDTKGGWVVQPSYLDARDFSGGKALVISGKVAQVIDRSGVEVARTVLAAPAAAVRFGDEYTVTLSLRDYDGKGPLADAGFLMMGRGRYDIGVRTDRNGRATFKVDDSDINDTFYVMIMRNGYRPLFAYWKDHKTSGTTYAFDLAMASVSKPLPELSAATLTPKGSVENFDILTEPVDFMAFKPSPADVALRVDKHGWKVTSYALQQGTVSMSSETGDFRDKDIGASFTKPGEPVFLIMKTDLQGVTARIPVRIRIRDNPDFPQPYKTVPDAPDFRASEAVPVISSMKGGFSVPGVDITITVENDKYTMFIGVKPGYNATTKKWEGPAFIKNQLDKALDTMLKATDYINSNGVYKQEIGGSTMFKASVGFLGYVEFTMDKRGMPQLTGGKAVIVGGGELSYNQSFVVVVVPVFICVTAGVDYAVTFQYVKGETNGVGDFFKNVTLSWTPFLDLEAGVGIKGLISISIAGRGSVPFVYVPAKSSFNVDLTLAAEFRARLLFFLTYNYSIAKKTWHLYPSSGTEPPQMPDMGSPFESASYQIEERPVGDSPWLADQEGPPAMGPFSEKVVKGNVLAGTEPQLVRFGDREALLWIDDARNRRPENRSVLMFAVRDVGGNFGEPKAVFDDGTNDASFSAVAHGGNLYVAWQKTTRKFDGEAEATLENFSRNSSVVAAWYDDRRFGSKKFEGITKVSVDGSDYNGRPKLVSDGKRLGLVWFKNDQHSYFGTTGYNTLMRTVLDGSSWKKADFVCIQHGPIIDFAPFFDNGELRAAMVLDRDGKLETIDDRYLISYNRSNTMKYVTGEGHYDTVGTPRFAMLRGKPALFWYQGGNILYDENPFDYQSQARKSVFEAPVASLGDDYDLMLDSGGRARALLWTKADNFITDAWAGFYNEGKNDWGDPVRLTTSSKGRRVEFPRGYLKDDGAVELVYRRLEYDPAKENPRGQTDLCLAEFAPSLDLALAENAIQGDSLPQEPGTAYGFQLTVANHGSLTCEGVKVELLGPGGKIVGTKTFGEVLLPGEIKKLRWEYPVPRPLTPLTFSVRVSPAKGKDNGTSPKTASFKIGIPELRVARVSISRKEGQRVSVVLVRNANYVSIPRGASLNIKELSPQERSLFDKSFDEGFAPLETKTVVYTEAVRENDSTYDYRRSYSVVPPPMSSDDEGSALGDVYDSVELNPFMLHAFSPSIQQNEADRNGSVAVSVAVKNNHPAARTGKLLVELLDSGNNVVARKEYDLNVPQQGSASYDLILNGGAAKGLKVRASVPGASIPGAMPVEDGWASSAAPDFDEDAVKPFQED